MIKHDADKEHIVYLCIVNVTDGEICLSVSCKLHNLQGTEEETHQSSL